jgi:hypothetical protein
LRWHSGAFEYGLLACTAEIPIEIRRFLRSIIEKVGPVGGGRVQDAFEPTIERFLAWQYSVDAPLRRSGDTFLLTENQTLYTNLVWNWAKNIPISNQVDFRKTNYRDPLLDAEGVNFYSEFQWKF